MYTVLAVWVLSMFVCSIYTFLLPAWDAFNQRRTQRVPRAVERVAASQNAHPAH